jgi:cyclopropane-fatty-acyl-phospholipid synthase
MSQRVAPLGPVTVGRGPLDRLLRSLLLRGLGDLGAGRISLRDGPRAYSLGRGDDAELAARIDVHDARFYRSVAFAGALGAAESYAHGWWSCDDLTAILRIFVREMAARKAGSIVTPRFVEPIARVAHFFRRNTRRGSRRNIHDHYDLGNDFFRLFLDDTMTYSCGIFPHAEATLREASVEKLDRVCRKLHLRPGHRVVEIGSGWGSFALHAASHYGCHVTTTTISREQHGEVERRIRAAGLEDRIEVLLRDYRDLEGTYDRLVSIEMIEAVGHDNLETYLGTCDRLLASDGLALIQAIVMPDRDHATYLRTVDFIQKYIFPGSCLPSLGSVTRAVRRATTLRFDAQRDEILAGGRSERFLRIWHWYFCYCEAGFAEKYLGDLQLVLAKPGARYDAASLARPAEVPA